MLKRIWLRHRLPIEWVWEIPRNMVHYEVFHENQWQYVLEVFSDPHHDCSRLYYVKTHRKAGESMSQIVDVQCQCHFEIGSKPGLVHFWAYDTGLNDWMNDYLIAYHQQKQCLIVASNRTTHRHDVCIDSTRDISWNMVIFRYIVQKWPFWAIYRPFQCS